MIKPVTMYSVVCDRCGKSFIDEFYNRDKAEWNYSITNEEKRNQCIIDFKTSAKWAINKFLKDL